MKKYLIEVRGRRATWSIDFCASKAQIEDLRADGVEVYEVINTVPLWVADLGLTKVWCFLEDVFNFRNPFS